MASAPKDKEPARDPVEAPAETPDVEAAAESDDDQHDDPPDAAAATGKKKKRPKKKKKPAGDGGDMATLLSSLTTSQISQLLISNPALAKELGFSEHDSIATTTEAFKKLNMHDVMAGLAAGGRNVKDISSYKFWQTQPVPQFETETEWIKEGPYKVQTVDQVPTEPSPLLDGFEWVTMDLTRAEEIKEVYELLCGHYVEDQEAMFRFNYSASFLKWALLAPGWTKEWHVGVRTTKSKTLVAFISGVPMALRVRDNILKSVEINFLCIHKKLRAQRLTPVLIKEITRRCNQVEVWQAIYTAGVVLPTPISTCRYYHRALDWQKLFEIGFSPCPANSKPAYQVRKYALPSTTTTVGLRPMADKDVDAVLSLLRRFLARFDMAPVFTRDELQYWMLHRPKDGEEQVIWAYVVEDPSTHQITDFFSFYSLASTVIDNTRHSVINAAYLFYYASEAAFAPDRAAYERRLNELMHDALILAKRCRFDVFNALTLLDNCHFLEQQKFGAGDGQLHFYLYNYRANPIAGGVDAENRIDAHGSGVGVVML